MRIFFQLLLTSYRRLNEKHGAQMAASLSFFTLFATGPVLILLITLLGFFLSNEQTFASLQTQLGILTGNTQSTLFTDIYRNIIHHPTPHLAQYILNAALLVLTGTTVIRYLQKSMNTLWDIPLEKKIPLTYKIHKRIIAGIFLLFLGLLVLISFLFNTLISYFEQFVGVDFTSFFWASTLLSYISTSIFIFLLIKYFPDANIRSKDVILSSCITAALFIAGKYGISLYLGKTNYASIYGAAGSLVGFLAWIYYSYLIFLFGVAFTFVYAKTYGKGVQPLS